MKTTASIMIALLSITFAKAQTIEDRRRSTVGYVKKDGTVENISRSTLGYAKGIKKEWAALVYFFFKF